MAINKFFVNAEDMLELVLSGNQTGEEMNSLIEGSMKLGDELRRKGQPVKVLVDLTQAGRISMDATFAAGQSYMKNPAEKIALFGGGAMTRRAVNTIAEIKGAASMLRYFEGRVDAEDWLRGTGFRMKLINKFKETDNVYSFVWKPDFDLSWKAGQFLVYELPHKRPDDRKTSRFFTISSAPFESLPMNTTRFTTVKGSTFKSALSNLKIGDFIEAHPPRGAFTIEDPSKKYVFIAGGIGITPFRSILLQHEHENKPLDVVLLYANRSEEIVYRTELDDLAKRTKGLRIVYLIDPKRVTERSIIESAPDYKSRIFYISGPRPMVEATERLLETMLIPKEKIKTDYFPGYLSY